MHVCLPLQRTPPEDREEMQDGAVGGALCPLPPPSPIWGSLLSTPVYSFIFYEGSRRFKVAEKLKAF